MFQEPPTCYSVSTMCLSKRNIIKKLDKNFGMSNTCPERVMSVTDTDRTQIQGGGVDVSVLLSKKVYLYADYAFH